MILFLIDSSSKRKKAKVVFDYTPENEDEMKIEVGEIVEVIQQVC